MADVGQSVLMKGRILSTATSARALGWASLAMGATELAATRWLEETMGVDDHGTLIRAYGMREIVNGAMILAQPGLNKTLVGSMWARVARDALDIATLATAVPNTRNPNGLSSQTHQGRRDASQWP